MKRRRLTKTHSTKKHKTKKHRTRKADSKKHLKVEVKVHHKY